MQQQKKNLSAVSWVCWMSLNTAVPRSLSSHCPSTLVKQRLITFITPCHCRREQNKNLKLSAWMFLVAMLSGTHSWRLSWSRTGHSLLLFLINKGTFLRLGVLLFEFHIPVHWAALLLSAETQDKLNVKHLEQRLCSDQHWLHWVADGTALLF